MADKPRKKEAIWQKVLSGAARRAEVKNADNAKQKLTFQNVVLHLQRNKGVRTKLLEDIPEDSTELKRKYEAERTEREALQMRLDQLVDSEKEKDGQLTKANAIVDMLRKENRRKSDLVDKYQRDTSHMEDKIRNLEIKASEVDKAELTLESTRKNLESSQVECRGKEGEIRRMTMRYDDVCKQLTVAQCRISDLLEKVEDLKYQVRHELIRNEDIEKRLETVPSIQADLHQCECKLEAAQKEVDNKTALLVASRKAVREYKDKLRLAEQKAENTDNLQADLDLSQCEIQTLKRLMAGKDRRVVERSQALDIAKGIILSMSEDSEADQRDKIQQLLETTIPRPASEPHSGAEPHPAPDHMNGSQTSQHVNGALPPATQGSGRTRSYSHSSGSSSDVHEELPRAKSAVSWKHRQKGYEIDVNTNPSSVETDQRNGKSTSDNYTPANHRPQTAVVRPTIMPSLHDDHNSKFARQTNQRGHHYQSFHSSSAGRSRPPHQTRLTRTQSSNSESDMNSSQELSDVVHKSNTISKNPDLTPEEEEDILTQFVAVGDRVMLNVPEKPEKYGKRKISHPRYVSGIIKFKGQLDHGRYDPKIYVGIRLDEEVGDTDGTYKGKRYMFTPEDHGKFVKLKELRSVFTIQTGQYKTLNLLVKKHLLRNPVQECSSVRSNSITSTA